MKKKNIPLSLLLSLKKVKDELKNEISKTDLVRIECEGLMSLEIVDVDTESEFYFKLIDCRLQGNNIPFFTLEFKP